MEREQLTQLVLAAQQGDNNAISALFNAFQNTVYNIALRETKDPETAADVVQESFIEVIQTIGKLQEPAAFVTWLKTITYHQCTRYYRKKENKHESLVEEREDAPALFDTLEEENVEFIPDKAMESEEFRRTIRTFIDKLPDVQRSAIMMKYFDDLSVKEIAAVQGVSENTVLSRLYYGRNAIKAEVEAYEKKHDTKLHAIPFLPLFRLLFNESPAQMPPVAATAAAQAVGAATGVSLATAATTAGAATTVGTAAVAGTVKAATIPLAAKIAAGVLAAAVAITAPIVVTRSNRSEGEQAASASTRDEDTTITTKPAVTVPADAVEYNGHYYKLYDESLSWNEAKDACEDLGGHLATITTAEEQAFLNEQLATAEQNSYWIGGVKVEDEWQWLTGETFDYTNWKAGEPNGYGGVEDRISVIRETGRWNDAPDDGSNSLNSFYDVSNYGYICEWDSGRLVQATTTTITDTVTTTTTAANSDITPPTAGTTAQDGTGVTTTASTADTQDGTSATTTTTAPIVYDQPTIVVSDAEAQAGDTVQITVRLKNNPGILSAKVSVGYDANVLTLVGYADGDFTASAYSYGQVDHNPFIINWCLGIGANNTAELLATLTFRVADNASPGDYPLTLTYDGEDFFNENFDTVYFSADEGVVRVTATTITTTTTTTTTTATTTTTGGGGFNEAYLAFCDCATYEAVCTECLLCDQCCACPNPNLRCADCGGGICPDGGECVVCNDCLHGNAFQDNERIEW